MIVTSINESFLPGLKALHNSILRHSPDTPLACLTYGDDDFAETVERMGIEVHHNVDLNSHLPPGEDTDAECDPMYARLLAPEIFDKCVWLDADQVVRTDLSKLFDIEFSEPLAAVPDTKSAQQSVIGLDVDFVPAIMSGLMVFNVPEWRRLNMFDACIRIMNMPDVTFRFVVQSVLNIALGGKFHRLPLIWQGFANREQLDPSKFRVLHWHGRDAKPWTHPNMPHAEIWRQYA